jgi:uncharacterized damage-inducible protein DinB
MSQPYSLLDIFQGWETYQISLVDAIGPLSQQQLVWQPAPTLRSVGQIASHISLGRIDWFQRMKAPDSAEIAKRAAGHTSIDDIAEDSTQIVKWLEISWKMVEKTLRQWDLDDLFETYALSYQGKSYSVSRQWTIWRIMAHDLHHGGEIAVMLGEQGIAIPELGDLGGHLNVPPLVEPQE